MTSCHSKNMKSACIPITGSGYLLHAWKVCKLHSARGKNDFLPLAVCILSKQDNDTYPLGLPRLRGFCVFHSPGDNTAGYKEAVTAIAPQAATVANDGELSLPFFSQLT